MQKILDHIVPENDKIIKYGQVDEKILLELKMTTSLYEYIEVLNKHYDDEDNPFFNNWIDVEGMGYGWAWMQYDEKDWHKMMGKIVADRAETLFEVMDKTLFFIYENIDVKTYHFITMDEHRHDIIIGFSNNKLLLTR